VPEDTLTQVETLCQNFDMSQTSSTPPDALIADLEFGTLMPAARFTERHSVVIDRPIDEVWPVATSVTGDEIKLLQPLFWLRGLPARLRGQRPPTPVGDRPVLDLFAEEGFVMLRRDELPTGGHAVLIFGAAGVFWSPAHNAPVEFESPRAFIDFDEPGFAKTVARFEAWEENGRTRLETETLVVGTDASSTSKFGRYWMVIRGPSGLLRRSWLSAIERRAMERPVTT